MIGKPHPWVPLRVTEEHFSGVAALFCLGEGFHVLRRRGLITVPTHVQDDPSAHIAILKAACAFCMGP